MQEPCKLALDWWIEHLLYGCLHVVINREKHWKSIFSTHFMHGEAGHDSNIDLISLKRSAPPVWKSALMVAG